MGLGLAISSRLASHLNTKIRLHSHIGIGSVFAIDIETENKSIAQPINRTKNFSNEKRIENGLHQLCIAVIDDSVEILNSTNELLTSHGVKAVLTGINFGAIKKKIDQNSKVPDIFLVDYEIEHESGIDVIQSLQKNYGSNIKCILITGETSAEQVALFAQHKLNVLYKPLTGNSLISAIFKMIHD